MDTLIILTYLLTILFRKANSHHYQLFTFHNHNNISVVFIRSGLIASIHIHLEKLVFRTMCIYVYAWDVDHKVVSKSSLLFPVETTHLKICTVICKSFFILPKTGKQWYKNKPP